MKVVVTDEENATVNLFGSSFESVIEALETATGIACHTFTNKRIADFLIQIEGQAVISSRNYF